MNTHFVRPLQHRPPRFLFKPQEDPVFCNLYAQASGRHVVGLTIIPPIARPIPPHEALPIGSSNPVNLQFFLGRIEEPDGPTRVLARLWERPGGYETLVPLDILKHLRGQRWRPGSVVYVWTWTEYDVHGQRRDRAWVEFKRRGPMEAEPSTGTAGGPQGGDKDDAP